MKISILLPYKENYSPEYPGAVSLFISQTIKLSKYKKNITVFGNSNYKTKLSSNYTNIELNKGNIFQSQSRYYVNKFIQLQKKIKADLIEVHNRPIYLKFIKKLNSKIVLYFHTDPLEMEGSRNVNERLELLKICEKIIFNSSWSKKRFLINLENFYCGSTKLEVINQSTNKPSLDFTKKEKIITFVGKLNSAKGYDLFGGAILKILNKQKDWHAIVVGDEPREKLIFRHKNLSILGFQEHKKVLKILEKTSIAVACSRWEEPFGRTSLEAASRGCAVIISNRGGLKETITNGIIINKITINSIYKEIDNLIKDKKKLKSLQKMSYENFYLTNKYVSSKIDIYRAKIFQTNIIKTTKSRLKIIHITNFNERHNGRLFYNSGRRINNGLVRLGHSVLEFSDRDIVSNHRKLTDLNGSKYLNAKLLKVVGNYVPDLLILGHADLIDTKTLKTIKNYYPQIKIAQWFLDRMDSHWSVNKKRFLDKIDIIDTSFCTTNPGILGFDKRHDINYLPNPVDESFERLKNYELDNFNNDVFFAMSHGVHRGILKKGKFDQREVFINRLIKKSPNIRFDLYGMNNKQPVWADNFINSIAQSKIGLNLSQGTATKHYSSDRFSQLIGNGLLVMIHEKTEFRKFFNEDEIILYKNLDDLSQKIIKYTNDDKSRKKISKKGTQKYFKYFNSTLIAKIIINKTFQTKSKKFYWEE